MFFSSPILSLLLLIVWGREQVLLFFKWILLIILCLCFWRFEWSMKVLYTVSDEKLRRYEFKLHHNHLRTSIFCPNESYFQLYYVIKVSLDRNNHTAINMETIGYSRESDSKNDAIISLFFYNFILQHIILSTNQFWVN